MGLRTLIKRRELIKLFGLSGISLFVKTEVQAQEAENTQSECVTDEESPTYLYFNAEEADFITAAIDILIPADQLSPSASQCGVLQYIDRQLMGGFGSATRSYMEGPWYPGLPSQGYQKPLAPKEIYRIAMAEMNQYCEKKYKQPFHLLKLADQEKIMADLSNNKIRLPSDLQKDFYDLLYKNTMEGFFADPIYLGNKGKASWKMIGYPGVVALYGRAIKKYKNKRYKHHVLSIEDI
jgi:gluconate 2-dehydrogenase gamma chain